MAGLSRKPKQAIKGERRVIKGKQHYSFPPEDVFPMLCPVREYEYLPGWECDIVYLDSGLAEQGGVFTTAPHGVGEQGDVWVISRYDPDRAIEFVRINNMRSVVLRIELQGTETGGTVVTWEQVITGLTEEGNHHIQKLEQSDYTAMLSHFQELLQHYFDSGKASNP